MRKHKLLLLLVLIFSIHVGSFLCYYIYLSSYQKAQQALMKNDLDNLEITKYVMEPSELYVNTADIFWQDNNKEIIINTILYDVISSYTINGNVILNLVSDVEEEKMNAYFADLFGFNKLENKNNTFKLLKELLALKYIANINTVNYFSYRCSIIQTISFFNLSKPYLIKQTPPPNKFYFYYNSVC